MFVASKELGPWASYLHCNNNNIVGFIVSKYSNEVTWQDDTQGGAAIESYYSIKQHHNLVSRSVFSYAHAKRRHRLIKSLHRINVVFKTDVQKKAVL